MSDCEQPEDMEHSTKRGFVIKPTPIPKKKSLLKISNSFQIQLPSLNRNQTVPTQNIGTGNKTYEDYNNVSLNGYMEKDRGQTIQEDRSE